MRVFLFFLFVSLFLIYSFCSLLFVYVSHHKIPRTASLPAPVACLACVPCAPSLPLCLPLRAPPSLLALCSPACLPLRLLDSAATLLSDSQGAQTLSPAHNAIKPWTAEPMDNT